MAGDATGQLCSGQNDAYSMTPCCHLPDSTLHLAGAFKLSATQQYAADITDGSLVPKDKHRGWPC